MIPSARWAPLLVLLLGLTLLAGCAAKPEKPASESPAQINTRLGLSYMQQGNYEVALEKLQRALEQDPGLVDAHHYIAELYKTIRNDELAEQHYRRGLRLSANDAALQNNFAIYLCDRERYVEAEERFIKAAGTPGYRRPDDAWQNAAMCMLRVPDKEKAKAYLRKALDLNPLLPTALYQMVVLSYETGEYLQARAFLQRYEAIARHTAQTLWMGVQLEQALDNLTAVRDYARQLRTEFPRAEETARLLRELD